VDEIKRLIVIPLVFGVRDLEATVGRHEGGPDVAEIGAEDFGAGVCERVVDGPDPCAGADVEDVLGSGNGCEV
jgi:hypothetical protein